LSVCILSERKISLPGFGVMSENELQARGQGFFGIRAAVLEPTELLNRPDSKLLLFWSFFFVRLYVCFFRMKYPKNLSGPLRRL
jgi:hypothetical protein